MIPVTGATGNMGSDRVGQLAAAGEEVANIHPHDIAAVAALALRSPGPDHEGRA
jgi:hypothetical protein